MKNILALIVLFVCSATLLFAADAAIENFAARSDNKNIVIEWRSTREVDVIRYEIERSPANQNDFKKVGTLPARGSQTAYRFADENAFLRAAGMAQPEIQAGSVYVYRLKIVGTDEKFMYSSTIAVTHTVSSVRRTWGMIKEMFR